MQISAKKGSMVDKVIENDTSRRKGSPVNCRSFHCVKSVRIWSYSGPYSVRMRENTDQNNSEYGQVSRSVS